MDELILVGVLGAVAEGVTVVRGAAELRTKESDRITGTVDPLVRGLGGGAEPTDDGFAVVGVGRLDAGAVQARGTTGWPWRLRWPHWRSTGRW